MAFVMGTHDGPFHADDVLAAALVRVFFRADAKILRTRDLEHLSEADLVFDVGGVFDPESQRFDHHQRDYQGSRSSAGMVLDWLEQEGHASPAIARLLRAEIVDYVDAVDVGSRSSEEGVPCFSTLVGLLVERADSSDFDFWFARAVEIGKDIIEGIRIGHERSSSASNVVRVAMKEALDAGRRVIFFDEYVKWKPAYFEEGGASHPTDYVLFPGRDDWRVVTIPASSESRRDKRKLPDEWAGLEGDALSEVVGVPGARFCHKNCFIAVFDNKQAALDALKKWKRL